MACTSYEKGEDLSPHPHLHHHCQEEQGSTWGSRIELPHMATRVLDTLAVVAEDGRGGGVLPLTFFDVP